MRNVDLYARLLVSGSIAELFLYPMGYDFPLETTSKEKSLNRARNNLKRLISSNCGQWRDSMGQPYPARFLTLTFAENMIDVNEANRRFTKFIKRLNYGLLGSKKALLKYSVVIEFQKRGAVHYHAIFYNLPSLDNLDSLIAETWTFGFISITDIRDVRNVGSYVVKYMTKEMQDPRLNGRKAYFSSRNLKKPIVLLDSEAVYMQNELGLPIYSKDFVSGIKYTKYFLSDYPLSYELSPTYPQASLIQGVLFKHAEKTIQTG